MSTVNGLNRPTIQSSYKMDEIESNLREHLPQCEIWGDLELSSDEYGIIRDQLKRIIKISPVFKFIRVLFDKYPITMVTDLVGFTIYDFSNDRTWQKWAESLGIEIGINNQTELGSRINQIFNAHGFSTDFDGGYKYITPIQSQSGIPDVSLAKLYNVVNSARHNANFDAQEFVDDLLSFRSYLVDKPVERFFGHYPDRSAQLVSQISEMMRMLGPNPDADGNNYSESAGLQARFVDKYILWCQENKRTKNKYKTAEQYFNLPKLYFDELRGVSILLPTQTIANPYINSLKWVIHSVGIEKTQIFYSHIYEDEINYSEEIIAPVNPDVSYMIELYDADDDEKLLARQWSVSGVDMMLPIIVFNNSGDLFKQLVLAKNGCIVVFKDRFIDIKEKKSVQKLLSVDLPHPWHDFSAYRVYPIDSSAKIIFSSGLKSLELEAKTVFDVDFIAAETLFGSMSDNVTAPVFTKLPSLCISVLDNNPFEVISKDWKLQIYHPLTNKKKTIDIAEITAANGTEYLIVNIEKHFSDVFNGDYGKFEVRISNCKYRKNVSFYLAPAITFTEFDVNRSLRKFNNDEAGFMYIDDPSLIVKFKEGTVSSEHYDGYRNWIKVQQEDLNAYIEGSITLDYHGRALSIPFKKAVRKLAWSFLKEVSEGVSESREGRTVLYPEGKDGTDWRMAIHFTDCSEEYVSIRLALESIQGEILQEKLFGIDKNGNYVITLNAFSDTMCQHNMPQKLVLYIITNNEDFKGIELARFEKFIALRGLKYQVINKGPIFFWDKGNEMDNRLINLQLLSSSDEISKKIDLDHVIELHLKNGDSKDGICLKEELPTGLYQFDISDREDEGFFFTGALKAQEPIDHRQLLSVRGKQVVEANTSSPIKRLDTLLETVIIVILMKNNGIDCDQLLSEFLNERCVSGVESCSRMLFTLSRICDKQSACSDDVKSRARSFLDRIDQELLTGADRTMLVKHLLNQRYGKEESQRHIKVFQLFLFEQVENARFNATDIKKMWMIDDNLALLMALRTSDSCSDMDIHKVANYIGYETIEQIVLPMVTPECSSEDAFDCFQKTFRKTCRCRGSQVVSSSRFWGDGLEYAALATEAANHKAYKKNAIDLNIQDADSEGYEVLGVNYLTLIGTWIIGKAKTGNCIQEQHVATAENAVDVYWEKHHRLLALPESRKNGGLNTVDHRAFYLSASLCLLRNMLSDSDKVSFMQNVVPFWKDLMNNFPKLCYRDLILAEIYQMFKERGQSPCR